MAKYIVTYEQIYIKEDVFEADSFEEAQKKWEDTDMGDELVSIQNQDTGEIIDF